MKQDEICVVILGANTQETLDAANHEIERLEVENALLYEHLANRIRWELSQCVAPEKLDALMEDIVDRIAKKITDQTDDAFNIKAFTENPSLVKYVPKTITRKKEI